MPCIWTSTEYFPNVCANAFQESTLDIYSMNVFCFVLASMPAANSLKTRSSTRTTLSTSLSLPYSFDWGRLLPLPNSTDVFERYCHIDAEFTTRLRAKGDGAAFMEYGGAEEGVLLSEVDLISGHCSEDADCGKGRPYCIDEVCRECREGYEFEDCEVKGAICNEETRYTCSVCASDTDCRSGTYCRQVFDKTEALLTGKIPRNQCIACDSVPVYGETVDVSQCTWRCPIEKYYLSSEGGEEDSSTCLDCPQCSAGQYYAPRTNMSSFFYSACTNASDVVCFDCDSIGVKSQDKNFCANILSPSPRLANQVSVGDLGESFPCRFFECKENWFLSSTVNKCKRCHMTMCAPGEFLSDCGGVHPGSCSACKGRIPRNARWIQANSGEYEIESPKDACRFKCPPKYRFQDNECVACEASALCSDDAVYSLDLDE